MLDLQIDPAAPGRSFHRIELWRDPNFWSMRAERRRIEAHPRTGTVQIVEVHERVENLFGFAAAPAPAPTAPVAPPAALFARLSADDLLAVGVP